VADEEGMTESQRLDEAGLHVVDTAPIADPRWSQVVEDVREYKDSKIPKKEIIEVVRILHQDYLNELGLTAEQAIAAALRNR
jgi:hypothetical protein